MRALILVLLATAACTTTMEKAVLQTSYGDITIELNREQAPVTVENFVNYAESGHYDGLIFHRVIPGFMIQGGGFTPEGTQRETNQPIQLESDNGLKNQRGTIAMARTSVPNSATSQFFINTVDNPNLDRSPGNDGYAVFGKVVDGMEVVDLIEQVSTETRGPHRDWPSQDVIITKAYMK